MDQRNLVDRMSLAERRAVDRAVTAALAGVVAVSALLALCVCGLLLVDAVTVPAAERVTVPAEQRVALGAPLVVVAADDAEAGS